MARKFECLVCFSTDHNEDDVTYTDTSKRTDFKLQDEIAGLPFQLPNNGNDICVRCENLLRSRQCYRLKIQEIDARILSLSRNKRNTELSTPDSNSFGGTHSVAIDNDPRLSIVLVGKTSEDGSTKVLIAKRKFDEINKQNNDNLVHNIPEKKQVKIINRVVGKASQTTTVASPRISSFSLQNQSSSKPQPSDYDNTTTKGQDTAGVKRSQFKFTCSKFTQTKDLKEFPWCSSSGANSTTAYITVKWPSGLKHKKVSKEMTSIMLAMMRGTLII
jgi:hypothetical protein